MLENDVFLDPDVSVADRNHGIEKALFADIDRKGCSILARASG